MKVLFLASVLSLAATSAAQAGGHATGGDFHAKVAPACNTHKCPLLATDGPPGSADDKNGRSQANAAPAGDTPVLVGEGGPGGPGDSTGRSMASNATSEWHPIVTGGKPTGSDFHASAASACDAGKCPVLADDGPPGTAGDKNGRSSAALSKGGAEFRVAGGKPIGSDFDA